MFEFQESVEIAAEKYGFSLTYTDSKFESDQKNTYWINQ